jgi:hypothetical protein
MREALAELERDVIIWAEDLATQERRLAHAQRQLATTASAEERGWVEIWQANVQHTREGYEGVQALLRETRACHALVIASLT